MAGKYDAVKDAKVFEGGVYFQEGLYRVKIEAVKEVTTRKGDDMFVVEATILESTCPTLRAGVGVSWVVMLKQDAALSNIKQFASTACDIGLDDVDGPGIELLVSDKNPLAGVVLGVEATEIETRKKTPFTKVIWRTEERIREKLDAARVNGATATQTTAQA